MKNLKTLLVALVMLLCLALPFGALASGDTLPTMTEQQIIDNLPADAFVAKAYNWIQPGTSVTAGGVTYTLIPDNPSYGTQPGDAGETYTVRLSVTSDTYALEVDQIAVQRTVPKRQFDSLSTYYPPTYEVPYGTTYAEVTSDTIKEQSINNYGADFQWGIYMDAFTYSLRGDGVIPLEKAETTLVLAPDYSHSMWDTYELSPNSKLEYTAYVKAIEPVKLTVELPAGFENRAYGEDVGNPTVNGLAEGDSITWLYDGKDTIPTLPGTYKLSYVLSYPVAYDVSDWQLPAEITIGKVSLDAWLQNVEVSYTGSAYTYAPNWIEKLEGYAPTYTLEYKDESGATVGEPVNAGSYTVYIHVSEEDPYYVAASDDMCDYITINPLEITPSLSVTEGVYNGENWWNQVLDYTRVDGSNGLPLNDIRVNLPDEMINAGEYEITWELFGDDAVNFTLTTNSATFTVKSAEVTISMPTSSSRFDGKDHLVDVLGSISANGILPADEDYFAKSGPDEMYHAGDYTFSFGFTDETVAANYSLNTTELTYTINMIYVYYDFESETVTLGDNSHWVFSGDSTKIVTLGTESGFPEGLGQELTIGLSSFDPDELVEGNYWQKLNDTDFIGDWTYDDITVVTQLATVTVQYADLDTSLTASARQASLNQWVDDVTFTPADGLEMTMDEGATWQDSFTPAEDTLETSVTYQVRDTATGYVSAPATLTYALDRELPSYDQVDVGEKPAQKINAVVVGLKDNLGLAKIDCDELNWSKELSGTDAGNIELPEITANGVYNFFIYDTAGNSISFVIEANWIDDKAPKASFNIPGTELTTVADVQIRYSDEYSDGLDDAYVVDPTLVITGPDGVVVYEYADSWNDLMGAELNGTYTWSVKDAAGNEQTGTFTINTIDTTAPVVTADYDGSAPSNQGAEITLDVTEVAADSMGNAATPESSYQLYVTYNDETTPVEAGSYKVEENGTYVFYAEDTVGNVSEEVTVVVNNIDTTAPEVTGWTVAETASDFKGTVTITIADEADEGAAATMAGVEKITVFDMHGYDVTLTVTDGKVTFVAEHNGLYTITGTDKAGNDLVAEGEYLVDVIDVAVPVISDITADVGNEVPANAPYNLNFTVTDEHKDVMGTAHTTGSTLTVYCNGTEIASTEEGSITIEHEVSVNGEYKFTAVDTAGNESVVAEYNVINLDLVAPELTNLKASTTEPTNEDVKLTFEVNDNTSAGAVNAGVATIEVSFNGGEAEEIDGTEYVVSENGTYAFTITDNAGNTASASIDVTNIDKKAPVVAKWEVSTATSAQTAEVTITVTDEADEGAAATVAGVDKVNVVDADGHEYVVTLDDGVGKFTAECNGTYIIDGVDHAGNALLGDEYVVDVLDTADPVIGSVTPAVANEEPTNAPFNLTFTVTDEQKDDCDHESGVESTLTVYCTFGGETKVIGTTEEGSITIEHEVSANGEYKFTAVDTAGNEAAAVTYTVSNLDLVDPELTNLKASNTEPTNEDVALTFEVSDKTSEGASNAGVATIEVAYNDGEAEEIDGTEYVVYENGTYTFTITDKAGNTATASILVDNIDIVAPVLGVDGYATTDPTMGTVTLSFSASDLGEDDEGNATAETKCGVDYILVKHASFESAVELPGDAEELVVAYNGIYTIEAYDLAGNMTSDAINVINIDQKAPTLEISEVIDPATPTSGKVVVSFSAADTGVDLDGNVTDDEKFGIDTITISHASAEDTVLELNGAHETDETYDALYNGLYTITVVDLAGNEVIKTFEITNIDQVDPTLEIASAVDPATPVSGEVVISFTAGDEGTDVKQNITAEEHYGIASIVVKHASFEEDLELDVAADKVSVAYNGVYTIVVTDKAGNQVEKTIEVSNIDVVDPTFEYNSTTPAEPTSGTVVIAFTAGDEGADPKEGKTGEDFYGIASIVVEHPSFEEAQELAVDASEVTVAYNGTYTFTVTDLAGNSVTKEVVVNNIDQVDPTIEINETVAPATPVSGTVVISFDAGDKGADKKENATGEANYGIASIVVEHEFFEEPQALAVDAAEVTVAYNGVYTITVTDLAGNKVSDTIEVFNIDVVKPTFEHKENVPADATNGDVTIKFTTDDQGTDPKEGATGEDFFGVDYILVDHESFDEAVKLEADEESLVVNANGIYTFTVVDLAGNSDEFTVLVDNIDVEEPTFEHKKNVPATATNGEVTINFTTADTGADVLGTETNADYVAVDYILVNHASFDEAVKLTADTKTFVVDVNGIYTFTVVDLAGNSDDFTVEVNNIDHTAPEAGFAYAPVYMQSSAGVKITLTTTDAGEDKLGLAAHADNYGLAKVQVTFGGKTVDLPLGEDNKDVTAEYVATADGKYTFTFTDKGGNVTELTTDMIYIDDIDPVVTARFVGTNLRIAVSDTERLAYFEICYRNTDGVIETVDMYYGLTEVPDHAYRAVDPGTYYVVVYDEAGNSAETRIINPDEDDDGVSDAREKELGTDPAVADTDDDGLTEGEELRAKTDPLDPDSDGDGLNDGLEVSLGSNPNSADSDSDGVGDYVAYQMGMLGGENQLFGAASMLLGNAYNPAGTPVKPGRFANVDEANAMMNNLESAGLASSVETSDFDSVKKDLSKAVKKTNGTVVQFNADAAEGLAVVDNYLMQFSRQKNQFVANKGYDIAAMLGSEEFIVLSNTDGSTVLVAPWSEAEQKTTGDLMALNLVADRAVKLTGTAGASHLAISASGESIAYNKDGNVIVLNLSNGQSTSSPVVDLVGLTFIDEMPVSVLQNKAAWGMENGEWKEMDFTSMKDVVLDQAQRTNAYRKVLLPGVEMTELEINIQVEVIMNRGDITAKTDAMKRSVTMYDLAQVD